MEGERSLAGARVCPSRALGIPVTLPGWPEVSPGVKGTDLVPAAVHDGIDPLRGRLRPVQAQALDDVLCCLAVVKPLVRHLPQGVNFPHQDACWGKQQGELMALEHLCLVCRGVPSLQTINAVPLPKDQTSDLLLNLLYSSTSGGDHRTGNLDPMELVYSSSSTYLQQENGSGCLTWISHSLLRTTDQAQKEWGAQNDQRLQLCMGFSSKGVLVRIAEGIG